MYGCWFGTYDVIGCGVTWAGCVYFTHNGIPLPLKVAMLKEEIYPIVSLNGYKASVKINYGWIDAKQGDKYDFYVNFDK